MALIGTIRKNFWFVLILLGLALAAFILMDMTSAGNAGGAATTMTMGKVAGEKIDYRAFQTTESAYFGNAGGDVFAKRKTIWDFYVQNALLKKEAKNLGLSVATEELMDLQFGANPSEIIKANWKNPQTGQLDLASLNQFKTVIENGEEMNPQFRAYWAEQEKQIIKDRIQSKLNTLVSKSVYTPNWMAEESFKLDNDKVDFDYIKIPFSEIDESGIEVTDAAINSYIAANKQDYEVDEETRVIEYASFDVIASAEDSASIRGKLEGLKTEFIESTDDSIFTLNNNGAYSHLYATEAQLPQGAKESLKNLAPGEVYGPFEESGLYFIVKMVDKKMIPDTVEARHILRTTTSTDASTVSSAKTFIDSLRSELSRGVSFDTLAVRHSQDPSVAQNGGKLGKFTQETMTPEFATACFATGKKGGIYTVTTQYGVHLLEVLDQVYNDSDPKFRIASIGQPITPSEDTQNTKEDEVTEILTANKEIGQLRTALEALPGVSLVKSSTLRANDYSIGALGAEQTSREMVKWAFDLSTEIGDVSPEIYTYVDKVNYYNSKYVIVSLNSIIPAGLPTADVMRVDLATKVLNQLKGETLAKSFKFNSLQEAATAQGVEVQKAADIGSKSTVITGIGNEPKVLAAAFGTEVQAVSQPIVGDGGVYIIQPLSRQAPGEPTNVGFLKNGLSQATKSQIDFSLIKNMTKRAEVTDERSTFF